MESRRQDKGHAHPRDGRGGYRSGLLRSKTFNGATCTVLVAAFLVLIIEGNADCYSDGRPKANP